MKLTNKILFLVFILCALSSNSFAQSRGSPSNRSNTSTQDSKDGEGKGNFISQIINSVTTRKNSSIMYLDTEIDKVKKAFDAFENNRPFQIDSPTETPNGIIDPPETETYEDNAKSYIYLGSILYKSPSNWSIWINDQILSSKDNEVSNELYIKSISKEKAEISWTMSISKWKILTNTKTSEGAPINTNNQVEFNFILSFNQTYILNGNKIVEGRASPSKNSIQQ